MSSEMNAARQLAQLLTGKWISHAIHAAAELSISDVLAEHELSVDELAERTGAHAPSLYRLLRALASIGIFHEASPQRFRSTAATDLLRRGAMRSAALMAHSSWHDGAWAQLVHSAFVACEHLHGSRPRARAEHRQVDAVAPRHSVLLRRRRRLLHDLVSCRSDRARRRPRGRGWLASLGQAVLPCGLQLDPELRARSCVGAPAMRDLPDIDAARDKHEILTWDVGLGDCVVFWCHALHAAPPHRKAGRRRVYSTRWVGDDARYVLRPWAVPPLLSDPGLQPGDPIGGALFPRVYPPAGS